MLRVFEAFSGVGTQRMALRNIGIEHEVVAISEVDRYAIQAYEAVHGPVYNLGDISKIGPEDIPDHDLFTYSFPCTDISTAGRRLGFSKDSGTRSGLLWECDKVINSKRPKYLLLENVKAITNKSNRPYFDEWLRVLNGYGYTNYEMTLNAKNFNLPQNRERVFVVSILGGDLGEFTVPESMELTKTLDSLLLRDEYCDLSRYYVKKERLNKILSWDKTQTSIERLRPFRYNYLGGVYTGESESFSSGVMAGLSRTLKANTLDAGVMDSQLRVRHFTGLECFRLMGMDDEDYNKARETGISESQLKKQAGNAIAVPVLEAIFRNLLM